MDARRISVSSGRKELSVSAKILHRMGSCGRTSRAHGVNQIAVIDILVALALIGVSKSIHDLLFDIQPVTDNETDEGITNPTLPSAPMSTGDRDVTHHNSSDTLKETAIYVLFGSIMFFQSVQLLLGFILLRGSVKRQSTHCKVWFIGQATLMIVQIGIFAFCATVIPQRIATWICSVLFLGSILYKIYCLYVVKKFLVELHTKQMRKISHSSGPPLIPVATNSTEQLDEN